MLEPQTRAALTEQLTPPPGFELTHAVGTTFTLDLATALTVPLSFASHRVSASDDQLGILDAIRRAADRIDLFAQAGEISMGAPSKLVTFLEPMLHPVTTPRGLFHPKVWFLEFARGDERSYRFLCASRNLTGDRSWDVLVRLDGTPAPDGAKQEARSRNAPLVALLKKLPTLTVQPISPDRAARINALADRWRTIEWEKPDDVKDLAFHAFGVSASTRPELPGVRALIISPFVTDDGLTALRKDLWGETTLVSRAEALDRLQPATLDSHLRTRVLDSAANDAAGDEQGSAAPSVEPLVGLHAKVVVVDRNHASRVFLGSSNATGPGWGTNVEVMVELVGSTAKLGVEATLKALGSLTEPYETQGGQLEPADEKAARRLETLVREFAGLRLSVEIAGDDPHELRVRIDPDDRDAFRRKLAKAEAELEWSLLTRPDLRRDTHDLHSDAGALLTDLPLVDITPFIVLSARDAAGNERKTIVLARLIGDIDDRRDAIIASQLKDRASFVRLLTLMLQLAGVISTVDAQPGATGFFGTGSAGSSTDGAGLFEALLRAVAAGHNGLADAKRVIDYLAKQGATDADGGSILPDGFESLWAQIWTAHLDLQKGSR